MAKTNVEETWTVVYFELARVISYALVGQIRRLHFPSTHNTQLYPYFELLELQSGDAPLLSASWSLTKMLSATYK